ncbi:MAG TPA: hypothetical protein VES40_21075 [Ilumatobacteraceae bacterium]|nr:hypothetical protein [Ilumatobacteraceae bacterium]
MKVQCAAWAAVQRGLSADRRIIERAFCAVYRIGSTSSVPDSEWVDGHEHLVF